MPRNNKRLVKEWQDLKLQQPSLCYIEPSNEKDLFANWKALILGPSDSPYDGTAIFIDIQIPNDYPFKEPRFTVKPIIYHPMIKDYGVVCLQLFKSKWSPALTIAGAVQIIVGLLSNPHRDHECTLNPDAARMYQRDPENYYIIAKKYCQNVFSVPEYQHLYLKFIFWHFNSNALKKKVLDTRLIDFYLPYDEYKKNFEIFEKIQLKFIPTKPYKMAQRLYPFIKAAENDIEKWIKLLMETGDIEYVENNIGYRLCNDLNNEYLWKMYFQFLREHNSIQMLIQMYSIYCRIFPEDIETLEEYRTTVKEFGISFVPWKNEFEFELFDSHIWRHINEEKPQPQPITCYFSPENAAFQNIPFKTPFINYIFQNASLELLQKLHMSCKFLFMQIPSPICYKFEISYYGKPTIEFKESSIKINKIIPQNSSFTNIYLSTILSVKKLDDPLLLSKCLLFFKKCDAKYISISNQNLSENELVFLIGRKNVIELELEKVTITCANRNVMMLEEILQLTPKIKRFIMTEISINQQTMQIISDLPFENKIEDFRLENLPTENLNPFAFAEFIKKNAAINANFQIRYPNETINNSFNAIIVKNEIDKFWKEKDDEKPEISIF